MVRRDWFLHYGEWALLARRGAAVDTRIATFGPLHRMSKVGGVPWWTSNHGRKRRRWFC